jgi:hypothetical protein
MVINRYRKPGKISTIVAMMGAGMPEIVFSLRNVQSLMTEKFRIG